LSLVHDAEERKTNNEYLPKENASLLVDNKDLLTKENDKLPAQMKPLKTELYALESNNKDRTKENAMLLVQIQKLKKQLKILESNNLHSHDESNPFIRTMYSKYHRFELFSGNLQCFFGFTSSIDLNNTPKVFEIIS